MREQRRLLGTVVDLLGSLVTKSLVVDRREGGRDPLPVPRASALVRSRTPQPRRRGGDLPGATSGPLPRVARLLPPDEATFGFGAFTAFETEHDNLRAAIEWSVAQGRYDLVGRMANKLLTLSWNGGYSDEAHQWLTAAVEHGDLSDEDLVAAYAGLTACSILRVDADARDYANKAIEAAAGRPFPHQVIALSLGSVFSGVLAEMTRDESLRAETRDWTERAITIGAHAGPAWESFALVIAGHVELVLRDVERADRYLNSRPRDVADPVDQRDRVRLGARRHPAHPRGPRRRTRSRADGIRGREGRWQPGLGANSLALALAGVGDCDAESSSRSRSGTHELGRRAVAERSARVLRRRCRPPETRAARRGCSPRAGISAARRIWRHRSGPDIPTRCTCTTSRAPRRARPWCSPPHSRRGPRDVGRDATAYALEGLSAS